MKILDFLFYYFVRFFDVTDSKHKKFKSHQDQAAYVLTICSICLLVLIDVIVEYILYNTFMSRIPNLIFISIGIGIYFLYRYVYINKGRYDLILQEKDPKFNVADKTGRVIVVIVAFSSLLITMLTAVILHSIK